MTFNIHTQASAIADAAQSPLSRLNQMYGASIDTDAPRFRIWTNTGLRRCRLCGAADQWTDEGRSFVCEHLPPVWGWCGLRRLDSVGRGAVVEAVEVE